jgi:trans-2,3-dihydro-3-hydroxyanthranilate isomerase
MQAVAREMAFSETVFVCPPLTPGARARLRIFTPACELPMAGHPTVGSTFALAWEGRIRHDEPDVVLDLGVGPTRITLEWRDRDLAFAWMSQPLPTFGPIVSDTEAVAVALGLERRDLATPGPAQSVSCGVPFLLVPLVSRDAVDRAWLEAPALQRLCRHAAIPEQGVFVFAFETPTDLPTAYSRMFAPSLGVAEDPATGSASGPLGCYLVRHGHVSGPAQQRMVSLQGVKMRRPSRLSIAIDGTATGITGVRVGGASVLVAQGELLL